MQIAGRKFSEEILARIRASVAGDPGLTRTSLSQQVCSWLGWTDAAGKPKEVSCRLALQKLERRGVIDLPASRPAAFNKPKTTPLTESTYEWLSVDKTLKELGRVWLVPVSSAQPDLSRLWWAMMQAHHPLGSVTLCGAQMRYLIACEAGYLGGLSFSASAWRLAARDAHIGWDDAGREANLSKVICNSRFLILPSVRVPHLASHVLGQALSRLAGDWKSRYGITPVLVETFVDISRYRGTCYRAANWIPLGQTQGRGRQDSCRDTHTGIKEVWIYPLQSDWKGILQAKNGTPQAPPPQRPPPTVEDWAEEEFGGCKLPDERLRQRLMTMARDFYARPTGNIAQACSSRAKTKAAYRFLDHKSTTMETLLEPHYRATEARVCSETVVLAVQDTSSANYTAHPATEGVGPIGTTVDGPQGLHFHSTLAFTTQGTPLGFLDVQCWARDPDDFGKKAQRAKLPIEEKESFKWLKSFRAVAEVQARCPGTQLVSVGDREADIYELFEEASKYPLGPKLLVRAEHNRALRDEQKRLWETVESRPQAGIQVLQVPRQGQRAAREAQMSIRYAAVHLEAPQKRKGPSIPVWAVLAQEQNAPEGVKPLEWMLLTTIPVTSLAGATEKLMWYARRWGIEVLHRTVKSGCRIEQRQLEHADRIKACLAIDLVVAWRIYYLTQLGREVPQAPCTVYFEEAEWKALMVFTTDNPIAPNEPPTLREAIRRVATLGGFLGRKCDGEPGTQTLWIGLQRLDDITAMWRAMSNAPHVYVSGRVDSG